MTVLWRGPFWLKPFLGDRKDTIFHRVTAVTLRARKVPDAVLKLTYLETLNLTKCQISSQQLQQLRRRDSLQSLVHTNTHLREESNQEPAWPESPTQPDCEPANEAKACLAFVCPSDDR